MRDYPRPASRIDQVEPVPRRVRAVKDGITVLDTTAALYVFEWAFYPQFYVPAADVRTDLLRETDDVDDTPRGAMRWHALDTGSSVTDRAARSLQDAKNPALHDTVRFEWDALDAWFEEDEQVFVHPRNPYVRVDALRSARSVRIELDGVLLAEAVSSVMVFETGLPTRYYLDPTALQLTNLAPSDTVTACPYKGRTTAYWSACVGDRIVPDVAWSYHFPTAALLPIAGLAAFYNEQVDITLDGMLLDRPRTHFSPHDE